MASRDPRDLLPLKPFVLHVLMALLDGETHGWGLLRALEARGEKRILPGQLYRQLQAMLDEQLIEERDASSRAAAREEGVGGAAPRRFFRLTTFGRRVAEAEGRRLEKLVAELKDRRLLTDGGRP